MDELTALGSKEYVGLEAISVAPSVEHVVLESDEVTAVCPVTGQPDLYTVRITFEPFMHALESKSLKLFLGTFRNRGIFCEALAAEVLDEVVHAIRPSTCSVTVTQKPRGGITLICTANYDVDSEAEADEAVEAFLADVPHEQFTEGE